MFNGELSCVQKGQKKQRKGTQKCQKKKSTPAGFEPAREIPKRFLIVLLNRSDTVSLVDEFVGCCIDGVCIAGLAWSRRMTVMWAPKSARIIPAGGYGATMTFREFLRCCCVCVAMSWPSTWWERGGGHSPGHWRWRRLRS